MAETERLVYMIQDYKDSGSRVDEVLFQKVMGIVRHSEDLKEENERLRGLSGVPVKFFDKDELATNAVVIGKEGAGRKIGRIWLD